MAVFVLDQHGKAIMPCTEKRARMLLERGRARVLRLVPLVIRLVDRSASSCAFQSLRIKLDPGSKTTGLALVRDTQPIDPSTGELQTGVVVLHRVKLQHRGRQISEALTVRRAMRRGRRGNLRHCAPRFLNRRKPAGCLAPSMQQRVDVTMAWVRQFQRWAPITAISRKLVRFDMPAMENPEISGVEYQQGTLAGLEIRAYLLAKWSRTRDIKTLLAHDAKRLERILAQAKRPLKNAAAVHSARWALFNALKATGQPVAVGSGGRTKWNRSRLTIPKTHGLDAVYVGEVAAVTIWQRPTRVIRATGRGSYQRSRLTQYGSPRGHLTREKSVKGFQTGDRVVATVSTGKKAGVHTGRVAVRRTGRFNIQTAKGVVQGIGYKHCRLIQCADGYGYSFVGKLPDFLTQPHRAASPKGRLTSSSV